MDTILQNFERSFGPFTPFLHSLSLGPSVTMEELFRRADRYSTLDDNIRVATQTLMIISKPVESNKPVGKKPSKSKEGQSINRKRSRDQSQKKREPL